MRRLPIRHVVGDEYGASVSHVGPRWIVAVKGILGIGERGTLEPQVGILADGVSVGGSGYSGTAQQGAQAGCGRQGRRGYRCRRVVCARSRRDCDSISLTRKQGMSESLRVAGIHMRDRVYVMEQQMSQDGL